MITIFSCSTRFSKGYCILMHFGYFTLTKASILVIPPNLWSTRLFQATLLPSPRTLIWKSTRPPMWTSLLICLWHASSMFSIHWMVHIHKQGASDKDYKEKCMYGFMPNLCTVIGITSPPHWKYLIINLGLFSIAFSYARKKIHITHLWSTMRTP